MLTRKDLIRAARERGVQVADHDVDRVARVGWRTEPARLGNRFVYCAEHVDQLAEFCASVKRR